MKEKLFYILPIVIILLCLENLFLQFTFQPPFDMVKSATMFERTDPSEKNPDEKKSSFYFGKGLILQAYYFSGLLNEIQDSDTPNDGKPEKTIAAIEKEIASIKISAAFKVFLIFLSLSTLVAIYHNVWFAIFMGRFLFLSSILLHLTNSSQSGRLIQTNLPMGIAGNLLHLGLIVFSIIAFRKLGRLKDSKDFKYNKLYLATESGEEINEKQRGKESGSNRKIVKHFLVIISSGILIGNIIYIPLFSLQKNYFNEFGILLLILVLLLCAFYIRNYFRAGNEETVTKTGNILISLSFLQYRFLRNFMVTAMSVAAITLFITFLFIVLTLNADLLKGFFQAGAKIHY